MDYLKSVFVGFAAVLVLCGVLPAIAALVQILILAVAAQAHGGFGIAFGPVRWHAPSLTQWLFVIVAFGIGFFWKLHRLRKLRLSLKITSVNGTSS
jgi:hypothetical protein